MKRQSLFANAISLSLGALFVVSITCLSAFGQAGTSTIRGIVKDPQGNVVSGAAVTLTNIGTNAPRTTTTSDLGAYAFEFVSVGDYKIEVEAKGFKKAVVNDVHALVSKATPVDVQLEVGSVSETVTVNAGSAELLINRDDATLGNNFVNKQLTELPTSGRSVPQLLTLQPATTKEGFVAGARSDQSNITLDGVDVNEAQTNSIGTIQDDAINAQLPTGNTVLRLNAEAIEEFRVTTANPNANQGRSAGAQISLVTKSGSNNWHGALFEFYRSKGLAANDFFNNRLGNDPVTGKPKVPTPQLIRHNFSGAVGGPIVKDKAFFFYSYEARRQLSQTTIVQTVPLPSMGLGQLRYANSAGGITTLSTAQLNTIFPAVGMNPAAIAVFAQAAAKYPANDFTTGDSTATQLLNTAGFRFNAPTPVRLNSHVGRFDFNLTSKQQIFVRVNDIYDLTSLAPRFPDTPAPAVWSHPWGFGVGHTWTINNRW